MAAAIVLGIVCGIAGFMPLVAALHLARRATATSNLGQMGALLLGVFVSLVILFVAAIICIIVARDAVFPFVLAQVGALSVAAVCFGVARLVRR